MQHLISVVIVGVKLVYGATSTTSKICHVGCHGHWVKTPNAEDMPLWIAPDKKVDLPKMEACMRDHYEGTPLSLDKDIAQGYLELTLPPYPTKI